MYETSRDTTGICRVSPHDALPVCVTRARRGPRGPRDPRAAADAQTRKRADVVDASVGRRRTWSTRVAKTRALWSARRERRGRARRRRGRGDGDDEDATPRTRTTWTRASGLLWSSWSSRLAVVVVVAVVRRSWSSSRARATGRRTACGRETMVRACGRWCGRRRDDAGRRGTMARTPRPFLAISWLAARPADGGVGPPAGERGRRSRGAAGCGRRCDGATGRRSGDPGPGLVAEGARSARGCWSARGSARGGPTAAAEGAQCPRRVGLRVAFVVRSWCARGALVVRSWCARGARLRGLSVGPSSGARGVAESRSARGVLGVLAVRSWCARGARLRGLSVCPSSRSFRSFGPPDLSARSSWSVCSVSALVGVRKVISSVGPPLRGRSRAAGRLFDVAPACSWSARSASAGGDRLDAID